MAKTINNPLKQKYWQKLKNIDQLIASKKANFLAKSSLTMPTTDKNVLRQTSSMLMNVS